LEIKLDFLNSTILLAVVAAYTYFVLGAYEAEQGGSHHGILWASLSAVVSLVVIYFLKGGWGLLLVTQLSLCLGIAIFRAMRRS
jgi:hypothetical protein